MLHERSDDEPETVTERELIVDDVRVDNARMRIVPLERTESRDHEQREAHADVDDQHEDPDVERQRRQEREETGRLVERTLEQDADSEVHERLGEVDHLFPNEAD